jgi:thiamine-monophosphate kinase
MKIGDIGEFGLIERIKALLPSSRGLAVGVGDDAAVLRSWRKDRYILLSCDTIVEGVHFAADTAPELVGRKALAAALSDIGAMGGVPRDALVSMSLPPSAEVEYVEKLYRGMAGLARKLGVGIAGGDTVRSPSGLSITVSVLGEVEESCLALRSTARVDDAILVTGWFGGASLGKHLDFEPRLSEARFLADNFNVHAMIDVSDGLAADLMKVADASGVGVRLLEKRIPVSPSVTGLSHREQLDRALNEGEEFELLLTMERLESRKARALFKERFPIPLTRIGDVTDIRGPIVVQGRDGGFRSVEPGGYDHFKGNIPQPG